MILIGLCLAGIGIAAGGKNYVLHTDLNKLDGSATEEQYKLLEEKTELGELQIIDVDLDNYDFEVRTSTDEKYYLYYNLLSDSQKSGFSLQGRHWTALGGVVGNINADNADDAGHFFIKGKVLRIAF